MYVNARLPNSCGAGDRNYTTDIGVALFLEIFEGPLRRVQDEISLLPVSPGLHRPFYKVAFHSKHRYARVPLLLRIIFQQPPCARLPPVGGTVRKVKIGRCAATTNNNNKKKDSSGGVRKCNVEIGSLMVILVHISIALGDYFTLPESTLIICRFKNIVLM